MKEGKKLSGESEKLWDLVEAGPSWHLAKPQPG
jgi:hypothetical protein